MSSLTKYHENPQLGDATSLVVHLLSLSNENETKQTIVKKQERG